MVYRSGPLALAHNGNLTNARDLRQGLEGSGSIFQTTLDTEIFLHLMALSSTENPEDALIEAMRQVEGAYALLVLTRDRVLAVRDAYGFRPLSWAGSAMATWSRARPARSIWSAPSICATSRPASW